MVTFFGSYMYTFLESCGIDQNTGGNVLNFINEACRLHAEYLPHSKFCAMESLQRLLDLLKIGEGKKLSVADHWMFVAHYVEETTYNKQTHQCEHEECSCRIIRVRSSS